MPLATATLPTAVPERTSAAGRLIRQSYETKLDYSDCLAGVKQFIFLKVCACKRPRGKQNARGVQDFVLVPVKQGLKPNREKGGARRAHSGYNTTTLHD